jgi:hypothetical protein
MAFTTEGTMGLVYKAKSTDWPGGLAHQVVSALLKKHQPQDTITRVELRQKLNKISMSNGEDPARLFEKISQIENRYNTAAFSIDEADLIAVVLDAAPSQYQAVLTMEQRRLGAAIKLNDLEMTMNQHWRQLRQEDKHDEDTNELTLGAFHGQCFNCKKMGHRSDQCPEKKNGSTGPQGPRGPRGGARGGTGKRFGGKCFNCGKDGHRSLDCWQKEENKDKRPTGYRIPGE